MILEVYNSFVKAEQIWQQFEQNAFLYAFQTYGWLANWYLCIGIRQNIKPYIVLVKDSNNCPMLLLPLGIMEKSFTKQLVWLGGNVSDYHGPLIYKDFVHKNFDLKMLYRELKKVLPLFDAIIFEKQPEIITKTKNPFINNKCSFFHEHSYSLTLTNDWDSYVKNNIKSKVKSDIVRQEKRLTEQGKLIFSIACSAQEIESLTDAMIKFKKQQYYETHVKNLFDEEEYSNFYHMVAQRFPLSGLKDSLKVHLAAFYFNDDIISVHWGLLYQERFYYLMPAYGRDEISRYSPGKILLSHLLEETLGKGIKVFDFTVGGEEYKKYWCNTELKLYNYYSFLNIKGFVLVCYYKAIDFIRKNELLFKVAKNVRMVLKNGFFKGKNC